MNSAEQTPLIKSINALAFDLYEQLRAQKGNLFFSPFSISTALTMAFAGARGRTAAQMEATLRLTSTQEVLHPAYMELMNQLAAKSQSVGYRLNIANALWVQESFPLLQTFLDMIIQYYGKYVFSVDFTNPEAARHRINSWVKEQTAGRITDLISQGVLTTLTKLVLTNAIYFKGTWNSQFKKDKTHAAPFRLNSGKEIVVPMMHQLATFGYYDDPTFQMLELPYTRQHLSMVILLPKIQNGLSNLETRISSQLIFHSISQLHKRKVKVYFPRFSITTQFALNDTLQTLGMTDAFSEKDADFSAMTELPLLFITAVLHKAFVEVNEEGTEATAATAVVIAARGITPEPHIPEFRADHPFLFFICDNQTNTILFMGRVMNPKD